MPRQLVVNIPVSPSLEDMSITQVVLIVVLIQLIKSLQVQACLVMEYAVQCYIHNAGGHKIPCEFRASSTEHLTLPFIILLTVDK